MGEVYRGSLTIMRKHGHKMTTKQWRDCHPVNCRPGNVAWEHRASLRNANGILRTGDVLKMLLIRAKQQTEEWVFSWEGDKQYENRTDLYPKWCLSEKLPCLMCFSLYYLKMLKLCCNISWFLKLRLAPKPCDAPHSMI